MAHQTAVDIIRVISEAVNPTGQFAYLRTWDASLEFNEVDQKIFLYPISGQVDITNGYFETWTCSMGFFFQDAPDSTNEQREQLITNADVLLKAFILAADTVDGVQFSIVRKRPVYRDMAGTYSGYLVDFTLSLTEDICNGDTPSVIIPVGKTFCELVDECLGISVSGDEDLVLNQKGEWVQGGGGAVDSVNGKTGVVVLDADDIAETATRFWLTNILKSAYDSAVTWISTNGTNLLNHLTNTSNPHSTTAAQVGAPSGSGTSTGTNTGDQDLSGLVPYTGATSDVNLGNNYITAKNAKIAGTGGNGFIELLPQNAGVATPASGVRLWVDNAGRLGWRSASGYAISFDDTGLNGSRNYVLPNASGTLALTSDLDLKQDNLLISSATASNSAVIDFTLPTGYDYFELFIEHLIPQTNATSLFLRLSIDGGATFLAGASDYEVHKNTLTGIGGTTYAPSFGLAAQIAPIVALIGNTSGRFFRCSFRIFHPSDATQNKNITGEFSMQRSDGQPALGNISARVFNTSAVNAIRLLMNSGNIASGTFELWGYK